MERKYLTQDEVSALPDGAEVIVTWSGGNGPHRYTVKNGCAYTRQPDGWIFVGSLTFCGEERFHTHVAVAGQAQ